jgi:hypothetical protein
VLFAAVTNVVTVVKLINALPGFQTARFLRSLDGTTGALPVESTTI